MHLVQEQREAGLDWLDRMRDMKVFMRKLAMLKLPFSGWQTRLWPGSFPYQQSSRR